MTTSDTTKSEATENRKAFFDRLTHLNSREVELVDTAYDFGKYAHRMQQRKTGERYFEHPRAVALILIDEVGITDARIISAALLHDVLEDTHLLTMARAEKLFGKDVAVWLDFLTKQKSVAAYYNRLSEEAPWQALLVKFADRLHNIRMMKPGLDEQWRRNYSRETKREFPPLGKRLVAIVPRNIRGCVERMQSLLADALSKEADTLRLIKEKAMERTRAINEHLQYVVIGQYWMESEAGWGQKPWGCTGHLSVDDMKTYNSADAAKNRPSGPVPEWYVYPCAEPFKCLVSYDEYESIKASACGTHISDRPQEVANSFSVGDSMAICKQNKTA